MILSKKVQIKYQVDSANAQKGVSALGSSIEQTRRSSSGLEGALGGLSSALSSPAGVAAAAVGTAAAISELSQKASELADRSLQVSSVFANVPISIESARKSTQGLISDYDLARLASDSVSLGVTNNAKDFAELARSLSALGSRRGVDALKSIEDGFTAIGRGSTALLDNLGITLKTAEAQRIYAQQLGKTEKALTDQERAEAFRQVAIQKVIEAAEGVTVTTDGAAAAVKRFEVELQNIEDRALAGEVATLSLRDGLRELAKQGRINIETGRPQGEVLTELRNSLRDVGVASTDLVVSEEALKRAVLSVNVELEERLFLEEKAAKAAASSPAGRRAAQEQAALAVARERLTEIENEQAFLTANNTVIEQKVSLQIESLKLQEQLARAAGDEEKANKLAREAELANLREQGRIANQQISRPRGRGRRQEAVDAQSLSLAFNDTVELLRGGPGFAQVYQDLILVNSELEALNINLQRGPSTEDQIRQADLALAADLRAIEFQRVKTGESIELINRERDAKLEALQVQIDAETQVGERQLLLDQQEQIRHEARLARFELEASAAEETSRREARARQESQRRVQEAMQATQSILRNSVATAQGLTDGLIENDRRRAVATQIAGSVEAFGIGTLNQIKAVTAFASGNFIQGAAFQSAAALAFSKGALLASGRAGGGAAGGGGGGRGPGRASQLQDQQGGLERLERGGPLSQANQQIAENPNNTVGSSDAQGQQSNVQIGVVQVLGAIDELASRRIAEGIQKANREVRK